MHDKIDANLISKNFNINSEEIALIKDRKLKNAKLFKGIYEEFRDLNSINVKNISEIDTKNFATYFAIQIYIANLDIGHLKSPYWNETIWKSTTIGKNMNQDKKWRWVLSDIDSSLNDPKLNSFIFSRDYAHPFLESGMAKSLLNNAEFQKQFIIIFQDISNYNFAPKKVDVLLDAVMEKYLDSMVITFRRFQKKDYEKEDYIKEISKIRNFFNHRFEYIMPYMKEYFHLKGKLVKVHKISSEIDGGIILLNTLRLTADEEYTGQYYSDYNISLDVETFSGYLFKGWLIDGKLNPMKKIDIDLSHPHEIEAIWIKENATSRKRIKNE